jgi:hypothetical protein
MDSENAKLRRALAHLIRVVEQRCADIVDVVHGAFQQVSTPVHNEMNRALVQIVDLAKDLDHLALEKDWEMEHMAPSQIAESSETEDELLIDYDLELNTDDIVGYDDGHDYSTDDTYPY